MKKKDRRIQDKENRLKYAEKIFPYDDESYLHAENMAKYTYDHYGKKFVSKNEYKNRLSTSEYLEDLGKSRKRPPKIKSFYRYR